MNEEKTKAVEDWFRSEKVKNVQTLLDFANFYRNLIEDFSRLTNSLNRLLRKNTEWT